MISLKREGDVCILTVSELLDLETVQGMHEVLDQVEQSTDAEILILTGAGKFFNNGLNLPFLMNLDADQQQEFNQQLTRLFGRLLGFPLPTVAAINGHAFAGGAVLAAVCDMRIMRQDRGWWCLNEVNVGVPIVESVMAMLSAKMPKHVLSEVVLTGRRYTAAEAKAAGIVDATASEDGLFEAACNVAAGMAGKERGIFTSLKRTLYSEEIAGLMP
ncbi:enoyl-CoA hydratase/isomerase family protein [Maricurvus nonylphenolicus]|uniref:enoyl-CoA hydratase/isomerase family protein n=1 Tax=Maricurvus nonylphenolicus TaxID=1008307 RepID=UPI0036F2C502